MRKAQADLINGRRFNCWICKGELRKKTVTLTLSPKRGDKQISVEEEIYSCDHCRRNYVNQAICKALAEKYPGYYLDVSIYTIKKKKKRNNEKKTVSESTERNTKTNTPVSDAHNEGNLFVTSSDRGSPGDKQRLTRIPSAAHSEESILDSNMPVFFSNLKLEAYKVCPVCKINLQEKSVNVPVREKNSDFYRYYACKAFFCDKCRRAYITERSLNEIFERIGSANRFLSTLNLKNVAIMKSFSDDYLYYPTLDNITSIFVPATNPQITRDDFEDSSGFDFGQLNTESFLTKMGYSSRKSFYLRHTALVAAVREYGKRKVCDHLRYLIDTRRNQYNGEIKFHHALSVWQDDLNYVQKMTDDN